MEGGVLGLCAVAGEDVDLEEGVEDIDFAGVEVGLVEGGYFDDLWGEEGVSLVGWTVGGGDCLLGWNGFLPGLWHRNLP